MQFRHSKSLFFRLAGSSSISVVELPPRRVISVLVANFYSTNSSSGSGSGQLISRRHQHDEESRAVRVSVWWDFENCNVPAGENVFKLAQTITSAVRINGIKGPITITAFGDVMQLSRTNQETLSATGIRLTHVPQGGKNSTDRSLITDLMYWVSLNPPPAHLFLISSDKDFASVLHKLRMKNYNILLAGKTEGSKSSVLYSAASIMWDWNDLVRGINSTGKHFNHPPDGPYNSWYGHYKTPLLDPFATTSSTTTKQQSCGGGNPEELHESNSTSNLNSVSSEVGCPVPKEVVEQISMTLSLYPKGLYITELRDQLKNRNVQITKNFYGHKSFLRFLLSMREILIVVQEGEGMFLIHARNKKKDIKASSPKLSSEDPKVVSVAKIHKKVKEDNEDVKEESQSQKSSGNGGEEKGIVSYAKSEMASSTSIECSKEVKAETEVGHESLLSRFFKKFIFWGSNAELSNASATGTQVDDMFAKDSFWNDVGSFINSPRGFVVVSHSRSREALAKTLKDEGPSSLKLLDVTKMLDLVSLLISEKKWIKENTSNPLPFRVSWFTEESGNNTPVTDGLRSIFVNMSKSQFEEADDEKESKDVGMSQKPLERSRNEVIGDCRKLIKKITEENPGGYNISNFRRDFLEIFGYHLDYQNLGYPKLRSLIRIMPEARIESGGYIVPSSMPAPFESDSSFEELGQVSKKIHEDELSPYESDSSFEEHGPVSEKIHVDEPCVPEEAESNSEMSEDDSFRMSSGEGKKKKMTNNMDDTKSSLLELLGSWDTAKEVKKQKKKPCGFGEDKLVEGILTSLGKKPSNESTIQG